MASALKSEKSWFSSSLYARKKAKVLIRRIGKTFLSITFRLIRTLCLSVPENAKKQSKFSFTTCRVRLSILCVGGASYGTKLARKSQRDASL